MQNILMIETSPRGADSASRQAAHALAARLAALYPQARVARRDLAAEPLPHLDAAALQAFAARDPAEAERLQAASRLSDQLIDELLGADLLVIAAPMWNFGIPSVLKAWVDLVVRAGKTFQYDGQGVRGLAQGKKAILVQASGGVFSDGPWRQFDFSEPYLRHILGFIGITDVQTVRVEGLNVPPLAAEAMPKAKAAVAALAL